MAGERMGQRLGGALIEMPSCERPDAIAIGEDRRALVPKGKARQVGFAENAEFHHPTDDECNHLASADARAVGGAEAAVAAAAGAAFAGTAVCAPVARQARSGARNASRRRQLRRSKSALGPTVGEVRGAWQQFSDSPLFFNDFHIAPDGGLARITLLFTPLRYVWAAFVLVLIGVNFWSLSRIDIPAVRLKTWFDHEGSMFLFTDFFLDLCVYWRPYRLNPQLTVAFLDAALVLALTVRLVWCCVHINPWCPCRKTRDPEDFAIRRWHFVAEVFLHLLPRFASVSAMAFLYFVLPSILGPDLLQHVERLKDPNSRHSAWPFAKFVLLRLLCLMVGFDAFMLKFRNASLRQADPNYGGMDSVVDAFAFLNQVLGVVQVRWFAQRRLHIFMFGGEDGYISEQKQLQKQTWHAMLVSRLWQHLPWYRFLAVMLCFDDYDFQKLILEKNAETPGRGLGSRVPEFAAPASASSSDASFEPSADGSARSRARAGEVAGGTLGSSSDTLGDCRAGTRPVSSGARGSWWASCAPFLRVAEAPGAPAPSGSAPGLAARNHTEPGHAPFCV